MRLQPSFQLMGDVSTTSSPDSLLYLNSLKIICASGGKASVSPHQPAPISSFEGRSEGNRGRVGEWGQGSEEELGRGWGGGKNLVVKEGVLCEGERIPRSLHPILIHIL